MRDVGFFIVSVSLVIIFAIVGEINFKMALGFFSIYFIFVAFVLLMEHRKNKKNKKL